MNGALIDKIAQAVLYEGYILYPYRRSSKTTQRWTFGCLFARQYSEATRASDPYFIQTQCLLRSPKSGEVSIKVRFLQLVDRALSESTGEDFEPIADLHLKGKHYQSWQEAVERTVILQANLSEPSARTTFLFPEEQSIEPIPELSGRSLAFVRTQQPIEGEINLKITPLREDLFQLTLQIQNTTPLPAANQYTRDRAQLHSMASTHAILTTPTGQFISAIDPPPDLAQFAAQCKQQGAWPVLVGEAGATDAMLASPIILYDYPQIAPESPGDLFDGTEIDEILSLRVMTLTDEEKQSAADLDDRAAAMLNRTQSLARDQLMRLHGTMRPPRKIQAVHVDHAELRPGDRVRLRPRRNADAFDIILRGKTATIVAIEQDYENRIHLAVTIDDDPGADIGAAGKIGHRFFYGLDEVEPLASAPEVTVS